jgi:hypothetical protein
MTIAKLLSNLSGRTLGCKIHVGDTARHIGNGFEGEVYERSTITSRAGVRVEVLSLSRGPLNLVRVPADLFVKVD